MLLGENGAGKSTLMDILSGAYRKDAGEILLDGSTIAPTPSAKWYVVPWLAENPVNQALIPLIFPHAFRPIGQAEKSAPEAVRPRERRFRLRGACPPLGDANGPPVTVAP